MKKVKLIFILVLVILLFSGCKKNIQSLEKPVTESIAETKSEIIKATEISAEILDWNEVSTYTGDLDGDGTDEKIMLLTSAERDRDGEFFWNDGQNWALCIDDREDDYVLFNQYLNAGYPYFEVSDFYMKDGTEPKIKLIVSTGASFSVSTYGFSKEDSGYIKTVNYDTAEITEGGVNRRFSSLPDYDSEE